MSDCTNCAGTGTTVIAVIALILVIIFIIIALVFFFFPSSQTFLEVRGTNFLVFNGAATGSGVTGTSGGDTMNTGSNNLYISTTLVGNTTLTLSPSVDNFVGLTIAVKNTTSKDAVDDNTPYIQLSGSGGLQILDGGISDGTVDGTRVGPGGFAWLVCTSAASGSQRFMVLEKTNPGPSS